MVGAGGAFVAFGLHKLEVAQVALHRVAQELFGDQARCGLVQVGAWGRFRDFVLEADHFTRGSHIGAELLLLLRLEPAVRPAPKVDGASRQLVQPLEPLGALEIQLGVVVVSEDGGVPVALRLKSAVIVPDGAGVAVAQELLRDGSRFVPVHANVDGRFGEGPPEVLDADSERQRRDHHHDGDGLVLDRGQLDGHSNQVKSQKFKVESRKSKVESQLTVLIARLAFDFQLSTFDCFPSHFTITQAARPFE